MTEHRTRVEEIVGEGWQVLCSCGHVGRLRENKFDAGEDEIAHHHTGGGPRTLDEIRAEEEERRDGVLGRIQEAIDELRGH